MNVELIDRLRCPKGDRPKYERQVSLGDGVYGNIFDLYAVRCRDGTQAQVAGEEEPVGQPGLRLGGELSGQNDATHRTQDDGPHQAIAPFR